MEIHQNKAVILKSRNPGQITTVIPKSKVLPDGRIAVHWGLDEMQVLKNLGIKNVPSPIRFKYNWPGQYKPFDHQRVTSEFLTLHRRAFLFSQQGVGKSASVAWAADYLMNLGEVKRALIICPMSIMDSAWRADLFRVAMHRTVDIAHGTPKKRAAVINSDAEFVIINYDGVGTVLDELLAAKFDLIVCDEANLVKNAQTSRWKNINKLLHNNPWLWLLTGTPAAQSPVDAYGLAKLVNPAGVPKFFGSFREKVMVEITKHRFIARPEASAIVHAALQPAIRFTKEECLDLPDMTYVKRHVEMTPQQTRYYEMMRKRMVMEAAGEAISAANAAVKLSKLAQVAAGCAYADSGDSIEFDISSRYKVLREVIDEAAHKVLIFVPFKSVIDLLVRKLRSENITAEVIRGDVSAGDRTQIFKAFQETDAPRVLVIQPQSAAHGVTLTAADTVVWWGPTPSVEIYEQANARVHRAGQRNPTTVIQLEGSQVERHIYSLLDNKLDVHNRLIDLYQKVLES